MSRSQHLKTRGTSILGRKSTMWEGEREHVVFVELHEVQCGAFRKNGGHGSDVLVAVIRVLVGLSGPWALFRV